VTLGGCGDVSRGYNELIGEFKVAEGDEISIREQVMKYMYITKKYHVFALMGRFQLELIYLYFPPGRRWKIKVN
jgi:hypothetical protein